MSQNLDLARIGLGPTGNATYERCFSRTVRSEKGQLLTPPELEIGALQCRRPPESLRDLPDAKRKISLNGHSVCHGCLERPSKRGGNGMKGKNSTRFIGLKYSVSPCPSKKYLKNTNARKNSLAESHFLSILYPRPYGNRQVSRAKKYNLFACRIIVHSIIRGSYRL